MSPLKMGTKRVKGISGEELAVRSGALQQALESGAGQLDPLQAAEASAVVAKVSERTSKAGNHTVVATYQGSTTHATSTSSPLTVTIAAGQPPSAPGAPTVTAATATTAPTWSCCSPRSPTCPPTS